MFFSIETLQKVTLSNLSTSASKESKVNDSNLRRFPSKKSTFIKYLKSSIHKRRTTRILSLLVLLMIDLVLAIEWEKRDFPRHRQLRIWQITNCVSRQSVRSRKSLSVFFSRETKSNEYAWLTSNNPYILSASTDHSPIVNTLNNWLRNEK